MGIITGQIFFCTLLKAIRYISSEPYLFQVKSVPIFQWGGMVWRVRCAIGKDHHKRILGGLSFLYIVYGSIGLFKGVITVPNFYGRVIVIIVHGFIVIMGT